MKRAEHQPEQMAICIYAGVFIKTWSIRQTGTILPQHAHTHPHITLVIRGSVAVSRDGEDLGDYHANSVHSMICIPANTLHQFMTLCDDVELACIHNADHIEGEEPTVAQEHHILLED